MSRSGWTPALRPKLDGAGGSASGSSGGDDVKARIAAMKERARQKEAEERKRREEEARAKAKADREVKANTERDSRPKDEKQVEKTPEKPKDVPHEDAPAVAVDVTLQLLMSGGFTRIPTWRERRMIRKLEKAAARMRASLATMNARGCISDGFMRHASDALAQTEVGARLELLLAEQQGEADGDGDE